MMPTNNNYINFGKGRSSRRRIRLRIHVFSALITLFLMSAIPLSASAPFVLTDHIHQLIEANDIDTALSDGIDAVTLYPDDPALLHELGRAAYRSRHYHLAIYYFKRSLLFRPGYSASLAYLEMSQEKTGLGSENYIKYIKPDNRFFIVTPYAAFLEYGDATPKYGGQTYQLDLSGGILNRGYILLSSALTSIPTLPDYPDYEIYEHRLGLGWFINPVWLIKAKYAYVNSDYDGGGTGGFSALGMDWLRQGQLQTGLTLSYADYPDGTVEQAAPMLTWRSRRFVLTTYADIQHWNPAIDEEQTEAEDEIYAMLRQNLTVPVAGGDRIGIGYAVGASRYGYTGFGDVLYSLPDKHTSSIYLRYDRPLYPFVLSLKMSSDTFETDDGDGYHSVAHTISLGYLSHNAVYAAEKRPNPWSLVLGAGGRKMKAALSMDAPDPLVADADVIAPVTFSDDTGNYTSRYAYELDTELNSRDARESYMTLSPYIELQRLWKLTGYVRSIKTYGRYTFIPCGYEFEKQEAGYQSVREVRTDFYQGIKFGGEYSVYETYNVSQSGRFDLNLHELALGIESVLQLFANLELSVGGGLLISLADWTSSRTSSWTESGNSEVLLWDETYAAGHKFPIGFTADLHLRWSPSAESSWFIETGAGYLIYDDMTIDKPPVSSTVELSGINATIAIGLR